MSRLTKEEIQTKLDQETCRANAAVISLAKLKGGLNALIELVDANALETAEDVADSIMELIDDSATTSVSNVINISARPGNPLGLGVRLHGQFTPGDQ